MTPARFKKLFDQATAEFDSDHVEELRDMVRQDWVPGPGYPRPFDWPDHNERRKHWADWLLYLFPAGRVNESIRVLPRCN